MGCLMRTRVGFVRVSCRPSDGLEDIVMARSPCGPHVSITGALHGLRREPSQ